MGNSYSFSYFGICHFRGDMVAELVISFHLNVRFRENIGAALRYIRANAAPVLLR